MIDHDMLKSKSKGIPKNMLKNCNFFRFQIRKFRIFIWYEILLTIYGTPNIQMVDRRCVWNDAGLNWIFLKIIDHIHRTDAVIVPWI